MLRQRRALVSPDERAARDQGVFAAIDRLFAQRGLAPGCLAGYWPMHGEPDPREAMARWHAAGWSLALPAVRAREAPLCFVAWAPGDPVVAGLLGTTEPAHGRTVRPDVILVPCVGVDPRGYRLGYGGGFYDRTLAAMAALGGVPLTIGVVDDFARTVGFEPRAHERPLDAVVSLRWRTPPSPAPS